MSEIEYKVMREKVIERLKKLADDRKAIDREAAALRVTLNGLEQLREAEMDTGPRMLPIIPSEYEGILDKGLTDAVRLVFQNATEPLTPKDVYEKLRSYDYRKIPRSNPLAAIHGVCTRLNKKEIQSVIQPFTDGVKTGFIWISPERRALIESEEANRRAFGGNRNFPMTSPPIHRAWKKE